MNLIGCIGGPHICGDDAACVYCENARLREALSEIARLEHVAAADQAVNVAGRVAREALEQ